MSHAVPHDIVEQILLKLDVKDLIRYKSVCKSWYFFISSNRFAKDHLNNTYHNKTRYIKQKKIIMCKYSPRYMTRDCVVDESEDDFDKCHLVGSSNGLLCIANFLGELLVANPLTREVKKLRKLQVHDVKLVCRGFGYDSLIDDYKVVLGLRKGYNVTCFHVLNLKTNVWKDVGEVKYWFISRVGILCNGALHWFMNDQNNKRVILSFDLLKEEFNEIPQPGNKIYACTNDSRLGIIEDCLCIFSLYLKWIMKNYSIKESWELLVPHIRSPYQDRVHCLKSSIHNDPYMTNFFYAEKIWPYSSYVIAAPLFVESLVSPHAFMLREMGEKAEGEVNGNSNDMVGSNNLMSQFIKLD